ncbi:unnamed protein product [Trichogramma brassicae]|uniref:Inward rectifier potassium channel C-terminal domain-containing protein n=1 Tax=Trichogramma brassicae TaxID=86971 RepID=A0A6H5IAN2_9HYME|nr:unnamed protein product [Trichogramma brassicae]
MKRTATESSLTAEQPRRPSPPAIEQHHHHHQALTFSAGGLAGGLRRAISQVSVLVAKTTTSSEAAWREEFQRYRQTRFSSRRVRKRVVFKHGDCNVVQGNVAKRRRRYLQDIFTTLVDAQWRWTLLVFAMTFLLSWLGFALVWWLVVYAHGDLEPRPAAAGDEASGVNSTSFVPCVEDIHGFTSCFLFSVETQHTIGTSTSETTFDIGNNDYHTVITIFTTMLLFFCSSYGSKHTTEECPEAIFIMCIQSMTGVILQAFMVGIVFAKLSRPKKRTQTLLFSRNAVICQRDGQACLMFRVGDMRKSHIIEAHVRAQMIKRKVTREGELLPFFQTELRVGGDGDEDKIFFIWPTTIVHKIDQSSPLYHLSASDMLRERFEIIVMLEGVIESTGMTTQARSSYLPSEILWGHRFEHIITFRKETGEYEVDYTLFNNTYEVDTPLCSAAELDHVRALHRAKGGNICFLLRKSVHQLFHCHIYVTERSSSATFAQYRIDSSSSLSTASNSGSSCASSVGGLHMRLQHQHYQHGATPPTPIPVTVTGPDEPNSRRGSQVDPLTRSRLATFYTLDEVLSC